MDISEFDPLSAKDKTTKAPESTGAQTKSDEIEDSNEEHLPLIVQERRGSLPKPDPAADEGLPFNFHQFLDVLRQKQAEPIAKYVKSFLQEFCKKSWSAKEQVKIIEDFRIFISTKMGENPLFNTPQGKSTLNSREGIEKLIMNRLYTRTFSPKMPRVLRRDDHEEDLLHDKILGEKLRIWSWIEGRHLDLDNEFLESNKSFIKLASSELKKINEHRAPRDKVISVLNCSKVVWAMIRQAKMEQNADSFLPILIYVTLKAQPPFLMSNINYINRFRDADRRQGETGYYLSMLASAAAFIESVDKSSLTIDDEEYEAKLEESVKRETERRTLNEGMEEEPDLYPSSVLAASAELLVEHFKSFTTKLFEGDSNVPSPPPESPEEEAAKQASAEEYHAQQLREQEFADVLATLVEMFPTLDTEVIEDVLRERGVNIGSAIDTCLILVE